MQNKDDSLEIGFTLAEILVNLLLLAIIAIGSFKTFHFSQSSTNSNLVEFQRLHIKQQLNSLERLNQIYSNISVNSSKFELLQCLITHLGNCELIP